MTNPPGGNGAHTDPAATWRESSACYAYIREVEIFRSVWIAKPDEPFNFGRDVAKKICIGQCLVRTECLIDALADPESQGIRAGFDFDGGLVKAGDRRKIIKEFGLTPRVSERTQKKLSAAELAE